ncbi:protein DpdF [Ramlibacter alkalitolerans]|uniref:ATP-dependent DNA helicase RecQ n=1 Tax=Ramlibacter alkalitolerans TaxID=2039631 RepID=A0ABS1JUI7_9BURK|nr:protein DpdF [Ramlibacter alkalitolerans]MBL0427960.1 ATP-dependent DNA helicase RecQ [Ramlibacter alkalitolerans]
MIVSHILGHLLQFGQVPAWYAASDFAGPGGHAIRRLVAAMRAGASGPDWAVLVRQCLRRLPDSERVLVKRLNGTTEALLRDVDVRQEFDGTLVAEPYRPDWVAELGDQALDRPRAEAADAAPPVAGEPWLRHLLGKSAWKSHAQREATWQALNAPVNSTLLVGLPTGSGKSLVYQCCAAFETGLTVLVVPTIALGIDQLAAVRELPFAQAYEPMFYTSDQDAQAVLEAVQSRRCRLLITSPEAIVAGRLAGPLRSHAQDGFLRRLVVDEAHLIESWGADFRVEFQLLGAVLREWRALAPSGVRVLLLSATFSPSTPPMLRDMFAGGDVAWEAHIVQRLRPEIHYFAVPDWVHPEEQVQRVSEALRRLPRPAILYVTEIDSAREWGEHFRSAGFVRFRVFHGDTRGPERQAIMKAWRNDELDLVVATSAFGMGVDKPDVKAVVHACFPEGIDRFYQEVGRGGRDGEPCVSLLVPKRRDERIARTMGPTLLKDAEKVNGRWRAMWHSRETVADADDRSTVKFRIRTDVQPEHRFGRQSFSENERWNKRLLLMMDRAGLIRIESLGWERRQEDADSVKWAVVRPFTSTLQMESGLSEMLTEMRAREILSIQRSVDALVRYFHRERAVCRELRTHYGPETSRSCGSCALCRSHRERPAGMGSLELDEELTVTSPAVQVVQAPALSDPNSRSELVRALRQVLQSHRVDRFLMGSVNRPALEALLEHADDGARPYRIDELGQKPTPHVRPHEAVVVLHVGTIDEGAGIYNRRGRWVAHWLLGGTIEHIPGRWPFLHEYGALAYPGVDGLSQWLNRSDVCT